jgi:hypothetical protein
MLDRILPLNLIATTVVSYVVARIYLLPNLARFRPRQILIPILLLHSLRHLGFSARVTCFPELRPEFYHPRYLLEQPSSHVASRSPDSRAESLGEFAPAILAFADPVRDRLDGRE